MRMHHFRDQNGFLPKKRILHCEKYKEICYSGYEKKLKIYEIPSKSSAKYYPCKNLSSLKLILHQN